jgi:hypothetical protein
MPTCSYDDDHCDARVARDGDVCPEHSDEALREAREQEKLESFLDFCDRLGIEP